MKKFLALLMLCLTAVVLAQDPDPVDRVVVYRKADGVILRMVGIDATFSGLKTDVVGVFKAYQIVGSETNISEIPQVKRKKHRQRRNWKEWNFLEYHPRAIKSGTRPVWLLHFHDRSANHSHVPRKKMYWTR